MRRSYIRTLVPLAVMTLVVGACSDDDDDDASDGTDAAATTADDVRASGERDRRHRR